MRRIEKHRLNAAFRRSVDDASSISANTNHQVYARSRGLSAARPVHVRRARTKFEHLAGHQDPARRWSGREGVNHGLQRFRIRVIAIVDDAGAGKFQDLAALVARLHFSERSGALFERNTRLETDRDSSKSIRDVVSPDQLQLHRSTSGLQHEQQT